MGHVITKLRVLDHLHRHLPGLKPAMQEAAPVRCLAKALGEGRTLHQGRTLSSLMRQVYPKRKWEIPIRVTRQDSQEPIRKQPLNEASKRQPAK